MKRCRSLSAFRYSIVSSILLRIVPSVGTRTQSIWRWNAPCTKSASSATVGAPGVSFRTTHAALQVMSAGEPMLTIMKRNGTRVLRHGRDVHPMWVKSFTKTLGSEFLRFCSIRAKSKEDFDSY